jgi:hypothetical protein
MKNINIHKLHDQHFPGKHVADYIPYVADVKESFHGKRMGEKVGYPVTGMALGPDGVVGAYSSKNPDSTSIKDVYNPKHLMTRLAQGSITGGLVGAGIGVAQSYLNSGNDNNDMFKNAAQHAVAGAGAGAALRGFVIPAVRYNFGKVFGKKEDRLKK